MALKDVIHAVTFKQSAVLRRPSETVGEDDMKDDDRIEPLRVRRRPHSRSIRSLGRWQAE